MRIFARLAGVALLAAIPVFAQRSAVPGWVLSGMNRFSYGIGIDRETFHSGAAAGRIHCIEHCDSFGTLMQRISAADYLSRRVRFSAWVKATPGGKPRVWMRVDGPGGKVLAFDNLDNRAKRGPFDWTQQTIVLEVPASAVSIYFGLILDGKGAAWLDDAALEIVDGKTRLTGSQFVAITKHERESVSRATETVQPDSGSILGGIAQVQAGDPAFPTSAAGRIVNPGFEER
jgi:hypothetical protein